MKTKFAFISRHEPTAEQFELADKEGIEIIPIGDTDAFTVSPSFVYEKGAFEGVIVVHPAAAMNLASAFLIGVFENSTRPGLDDKPQFFAKSIKIWDLRD